MMSADIVCERMFRSPSSVAVLDAVFDAVRTQLRMVHHPTTMLAVAIALPAQHCCCQVLLTNAVQINHTRAMGLVCFALH